MKKKLLLKLADLLKADAKNPNGVKFDLETWGTVKGRDDQPSVSCGTAACAMGLAALSGEFKKQGLYHSNTYRLKMKVYIYTGKYYAEGFNAASFLFGIPERHAVWLFSNRGYKTRKNPQALLKGADGERKVARRIRAYVAGTARPSRDFDDFI